MLVQQQQSCVAKVNADPQIFFQMGPHGFIFLGRWISNVFHSVVRCSQHPCSYILLEAGPQFVQLQIPMVWQGRSHMVILSRQQAAVKD